MVWFGNQSCADVNRSSNFLRPKWVDLCKLANRNRPSFWAELTCLPSHFSIQVKSSVEYSGGGGVAKGALGQARLQPRPWKDSPLLLSLLLDLLCCYRQLPASWQTGGLGHTSLPLPSVFSLPLIDAGPRPSSLDFSLLLCGILFRDRWPRGHGWYQKHSGYRCRY
jgi:hypothetical protein